MEQRTISQLAKGVLEELEKQCYARIVNDNLKLPHPSPLLFFDKTGPTKETWFYRFELPEGYKAFSKTRPLTLEHMQVITDWWDNRVEIKDDKEDVSMTETWKAKKFNIEEIIERGYNIDLCGFPTKEEVILSPEDTINNFKEKRASLDAKMDEKLQDILNLLGVE